MLLSTEPLICTLFGLHTTLKSYTPSSILDKEVTVMLTIHWYTVPAPAAKFRRKRIIPRDRDGEEEDATDKDDYDAP